MAPMKRRAALAATAITLLACSVASVTSAADLGDGILVGRVANVSTSVNRRLFVDVNGREWALHLAGTSRVFHNREKYSVHDLDAGTWVKAEGKRIGRLRLEVFTLYVIGSPEAYRKSGAYRQRQPAGYFVSL